MRFKRAGTFASMEDVSTKELGRSASRLVDSALQEPVTIGDDERDVAVLLSVEAYRKLTRREAIAELNELCDRVGARGAKPIRRRWTRRRVRASTLASVKVGLSEP
jgi:PHD/YefM family antitoxin component YafN of YafNO toxin-antitoxin module